MKQALLEIFGILKSSNFEPLVPYLIYVGICIALVAAFLIFISILDGKRKEKEHLLDYVVFKLKPEDITRPLLSKLYFEHMKKFKSKEFFVMDILNNEVYLKIRKELLPLFEELKPQVSMDIGKKISVSSHKFKDFFEYISSTDFAIPYLPKTLENKSKINIYEGEMFGIQICFRPIQNKWTKAVVDLKRGLEEGRDETKRVFGVVGAVAGATYPFMKKTSEKIAKGTFINDDFKNKHALTLEKLKDDSGFETLIKVYTFSNDEKFLENVNSYLEHMVNSNLANGSNTFLVNSPRKLGKGEQNSIVFSNLPVENNQILNISECLGLIGRVTK